MSHPWADLFFALSPNQLSVCQMVANAHRRLSVPNEKYINTYTYLYNILTTCLLIVANFYCFLVKIVSAWRQQKQQEQNGKSLLFKQPTSQKALVQPLMSRNIFNNYFGNTQFISLFNF